MSVTTARAIVTADDLDAVRDDYIERTKDVDFTIMLCSGAGCLSSKAGEIAEALERELAAAGLADRTLVKYTGCIGACGLGPALIADPDGVFYCHLKASDVHELVTEHLLNGRVVERLCYHDLETGLAVPKFDDIPFFARQRRIVLRNCGRADHDDLGEYVARGGYRAALKAMTEMTPKGVVDEVIASGLRGRGGGGFPTGRKWAMAAAKPDREKYVICNGDEGDPGAFMDRSVLEGDPHSVIEGMLIAGYAIGASHGVVYVRAEYPLAVERLETALGQAREVGLLGEHVFGTEHSFDIEIRIGAGAFVCGEETALMSSVEGRRGEPHQKPPFPSDMGLFRRPTIINNVETLANIAPIIAEGGEWFASIGIAGSSGTKVFALAGDIENTGLVEVPMGISLGEVIFDIGGGVPNGGQFKVAQTGGPSGGCLTPAHLNTKIDYDSLVKLGAIMGSGGLVVMDTNTCMVDVAKYFMQFCADESCGKCVPCRIGTTRMLEILTRITAGEGREGDVEKLVELCDVVRDTALCGLGQTAPNPILSTIRYFREEYDEHIRDHYCRAGVCSDLFLAPCVNACPAHVDVPGYLSLIAAGRPLDAYRLIRQENPFPSVCGRVCTHPCELACRRGQLDEPIDIRAVKRYAADVAYESGAVGAEAIPRQRDGSVGIIGAGPSGLTAAYYLRLSGYDVDVYEQQPVAGGMLAVGIPEFRLPKGSLQREIDTIRVTGVRIQTGVEVGRDVSFDELMARHDALYLAVGTQVSWTLGIPGEDLPGVVHGLDYLRQVNLGGASPEQGSVIVIGGGNTALDAARTALREGAEKVTILYRRRVMEMPAAAEEIAEAREEGIEIRELVAPVAIEATGDRLTVRCRRMGLEGFSDDGRRRVVPSQDEEESFTADLVIPAVSQFVDSAFTEPAAIRISSVGTFEVDRRTSMTNVPGVFAGGDAMRGPDVVIDAIADGKAVASSIDRYLGGDGELWKGPAIDVPEPWIDDDDTREHGRFGMCYLDPEKRARSYDEVALGYHRVDAVAESLRCLHCDRR
jgi:NADH-quinone oxidoreductase subunit F